MFELWQFHGMQLNRVEWQRLLPVTDGSAALLSRAEALILWILGHGLPHPLDFPGEP